MLVLASQSPRRREILNSLNIPFTLSPPDVKEYDATSCYKEHLPIINAKLKSESVARKFPGQLVLGADTVVEFNGNTIEKPSDTNMALDMLMSLSGKQHQVITAVCLTREEEHVSVTFAERSIVEFNNFSERTALEYMKKVYVLDKAGAYAAQEHGEIIIKKISGSVTNVMGLPAEKLMEALNMLNRNTL